MILTDEDKLRIWKLLGFLRPGHYRLKTSEQYNQERITLNDWHEVTIKGSTLPKQLRRDYKDYTLVIFGWDLYNKTLTAGWYGPAGIVNFSRFNDLGIPTPNRPLHLCGARIYYKKSKAFAEMLIRGHVPEDRVIDHKDKNGTVKSRTILINSIDSIQNVQQCKTAEEIAKVWRGFNLCKDLFRPRGRERGFRPPKREPSITLKEIEEKIQKILTSNPGAEITYSWLRLGPSRDTIRRRIQKDTNRRYLTLESFVDHVRKNMRT